MLCRSQQVVNMMLMCFENDVVPVTASCELDVDVYVVVPVTTTSSTEATRMYDIVQHVVPVTTTSSTEATRMYDIIQHVVPVTTTNCQEEKGWWVGKNRNESIKSFTTTGPGLHFRG